MSDEHLKKIQKDVDEMNRAFSFDVADEDVRTEPPSTIAPDVSTEPPASDEPVDDETKTEPPTTDEPEDKDETIRKLREKLAERDKDEPKTDAPKTQPPSTEAPIADVNFLGDTDDEDFELPTDKEELNKLFNKVYKEAVKAGRIKQDPSILEAMPNLISSVTNLQKLTEEFYSNNKDLVPFKKVVGATFEELVGSNPSKSHEEVLKDVAPLVRERLELPKPKLSKDKETPPRLPRSKAKPGRAQDDNEPTSTESQIAEMNKSLGR